MYISFSFAKSHTVYNLSISESMGPSMSACLMYPIYLQTPKSPKTPYLLMGARNSITYRLKIHVLIPKTQVTPMTVHSFYGRCECVIWTLIGWRFDQLLTLGLSLCDNAVSHLNSICWITVYIWFVNAFLLVH